MAVVTRVAQQSGPIDVAILFVGAVQIPTRFDGAYLTLSLPPPTRESSHGVPLRKLKVYLPTGLGSFHYWNLGVQIGGRTEVLTIRT